jgi:hypothetical protein
VTETAVADPEAITLACSEDAAELVDRMTDELGLWTSRVDAGLFLVGLAVARGDEPVPEGERGPADDELGSLAEAGGEDLDHLAILDVIDEDGGELSATLEAELPAWIEAGADRLGPRLEGTDATEAAAELAEIVRDVD